MFGKERRKDGSGPWVLEGSRNFYWRFTTKKKKKTEHTLHHRIFFENILFFAPRRSIGDDCIEF